MIGDWVSNYAKKAIHSKNSNLTDLANTCNALLKGGFLRVPLGELKINKVELIDLNLIMSYPFTFAFKESASQGGPPQTERQKAVATLSNLVHVNFGEDCKGLLTITPTEFDVAVERIFGSYKNANPDYSKLHNYSHWLANYSSDESDYIEMPGQRLEFSSTTKRLITIERIDPNVKVRVRLYCSQP
ncbi:unnamed protein product [Rodentolepis nana]|uniref:DNA helicase n=1 Tax=Rodentolepis nana TaxID=102285 RepID=A0A0R3TFM2_RODNA|nr:unnamed protein product [Rodentolepis nana]